MAGVCRCRYSVHSTCFFLLYQGYDIPVSGEAHLIAYEFNASPETEVDF